MEEETTECTNCQRPISTSNYVMHSLHCHRKLEKCRICGEAVPRTEMGTHAEQHADELCSECGESVPRDLLDTHKGNKCKFRKVSCLYCSLEMPATDMQEHEDYCGSRTERCNDCGKFVMLKYQQLHLDSNHGFLKLDDEPSPSPRPKLGDYLVKKVPKQSQLHSGLPSNDPVASLDRLLALRLGEDDPHFFPDRNSASSSGSASRDPHDDVELPCEFCLAVMPVHKLLEHQTGCRPDLTSFATSDTASKVEKTSVNSALRNGLSRAYTRSGVPIVTLDESDDEVTALDQDGIDVELPCEFCEMTYPASVLNHHQEICEARLSGVSVHWTTLPTADARVVTPPLTRKRVIMEAQASAEEDHGATRNAEVRKSTTPSANPRSSHVEGAENTPSLQTRSTSAGAVPKQKYRKKRKAPAPPTLT